MDDCLACDLTHGRRPLPGRLVHRTDHWLYNCLWSHAAGRPVHIHFVVQLVVREQTRLFDAHGPALQVAMFQHGELPGRTAGEHICDAARPAFPQA